MTLDTEDNDVIVVDWSLPDSFLDLAFLLHEVELNDTDTLKHDLIHDLHWLVDSWDSWFWGGGGLLIMSNWLWFHLSWFLMNWFNDSYSRSLISWNFWIMMNDMMTTMNTWISLISAPSTRRCEKSIDASWSLSEPETKGFLMIIVVEGEHEDWQRRRRDRWCWGWLRVGWILNLLLTWTDFADLWNWPWRYSNEEDVDLELMLEHILWEHLTDWSEFRPSWAPICPSLTSSWIQRYLSSMCFERLERSPILKPLIFPLMNLSEWQCWLRMKEWLSWTPEWNSWLQVTLLLLESLRRVHFLLKNEQLKPEFCLLTEDWHWTLTPMNHLLTSLIFDNLPNLNLNSWQSELETCLLDSWLEAEAPWRRRSLLSDWHTWASEWDFWCPDLGGWWATLKLLDRILEVIPELSHPKKFSNSWPELLMNDFVTLSLLIFWKSLKFESCGCDLARDSKILSNSSNELLREFHCDVAILESLDCSAQELYRIRLKWGSWHAWVCTLPETIVMNSLTIWAFPEMTRSST